MIRDVILDTNTLLNGIDLSEYNKVYIPIVVLEELDSIKHKSEGEKNFRVRKAIKQIEEADNVEYRLEYKYSLPYYLNANVPDDRILAYVKDICNENNNAILLSEDINLLSKAKALNIPYKKYTENNVEEIYKGYKTIQGGTAFINEFFDNINNRINEYGFVTNEYLILYNSDLDDIYEYRFDGHKFVDLKLPPSKTVKGINSLQRCALDLLNNKDIPIKIVAGGFGSGKSLMSVKTGLYNVVDKENYKTLMFIRNPIVADGAEIGFLPGDKSEKIADFCRPFLQYVESSKDQFYADTLIRTEKIRMDVVSFLKGVSIDDSFVIMDEAEDLNTKLIKLVGSRIGKTSCIVFTGDWSQSENKYKTENGLVKLIQDTKGNSLVGTIVLDEDVRSEASKIFANL